MSVQKRLGATVCQFRRTENSPTEPGIAVLRNTAVSDIYIIVDMDGKIVTEPLWNYQLLNYEGCFVLNTFWG